MGKYYRLACEERYQVEALLGSGHGVNEVARLLKRSASTISREINRARSRSDYSAKAAVELARQRSRREGNPKITHAREELIREKLAFELSPEQISGWLRKKRIRISHETIYKFIYRDRSLGGTLWTHLRRRRRWRRNRAKARNFKRCGQRIDRTSIEERPEIVNKRRRIGDFERDLMKGQGGVFLTVVDRKSKLVRIESLGRTNGIAVHQATLRALKGLEAKTITNDNGAEFCDHALTAKELGNKIYFSHPYASWERGTNENTNGLIRQYFSRQTTPTPELARYIEERLNNRPRKTLGYRTPNEVHRIKSEGVALAD